MSRHLNIGRSGEEFAAFYLIQQGYRILQKRYRNKKYEIDIICENENIVVFVEVKTRSDTYFGYPEEAVTKAKEKKIERCADQYIESNEIRKEIRFDIISVVIDQDHTSITHIRDAFFPNLTLSGQII